MEIMSNFEKAVFSEWFIKCLKHLEHFKMNTGKYSFPKNYLIEKKDNCRQQSMGLGENRRKKESIIIESTFRMLRLKKKVKMFEREL